MKKIRSPPFMAYDENKNKRFCSLCYHCTHIFDCIVEYRRSRLSVDAILYFEENHRSIEFPKCFELEWVIVEDSE